MQIFENNSIGIKKDELIITNGEAGQKIIKEEYALQTTSMLSEKISKDLKKRGMKFVGSTIIYSYLQAIGVIISHEKDCFMYKGK